MADEQQDQSWRVRAVGQRAGRPRQAERVTDPQQERSLREHQQLQAEYARALARAEQQEAQAQALSALSQSVSVAQEPDDLRHGIAEALYDALRADTTSLFQREEDGRLRMVAQRNIDVTRARIIFGPDEGLIALAMREGRVVHVPDTAASAHYLATGYDRPRSLLALPIYPQAGPIYVLCVVRRRVYAFTDDEVQFATIMASVAAQALGNAALYHQMQRMAAEQATFSEIAQAASFSDSLTNFIGRAIDPLCRALHASGCSVAFVPARSGEGAAHEPIIAHAFSAFAQARSAAFIAELAGHPQASLVALRCVVSPEDARLVLAPIVVRGAPVAVVAWETQRSARDAPPALAEDDPAAGQWGLGDDPAPPLALGDRAAPLIPLRADETAFITNVTQHLALGIEHLRLRSQDLTVLRSLSALPASRLHLDHLRRDIVREVERAFAPAAVALLLSDPAPRIAAASTPQQAPWVQSALALAANAQQQEFLQRRGVALAALTADHETLGWLALRLSGASKLAPDRALLFTSLAGAAALLLRNARLHLMAREAAVDRERQRLAREIHDGVAQNLAHLMLRLELIVRLIPADPARARAESQAAREVLLTSLNDLRQSIAALAPAQLEQHGFAGAVRTILDDIATNTPDLHVTFTACDDDLIPPELRAPAFRIVQEALTNIRKHAQARHAWVTVAIAHGDALHITIRDDGQGFDTDLSALPTGHFGLQGMRDRAGEYGGTFTLASSPGTGTTITVAFPLAA